MWLNILLIGANVVGILYPVLLILCLLTQVWICVTMHMRAAVRTYIRNTDLHDNVSRYICTYALELGAIPVISLIDGIEPIPV